MSENWGPDAHMYWLQRCKISQRLVRYLSDYNDFRHLAAEILHMIDDILHV